MKKQTLNGRRNGESPPDSGGYHENSNSQQTLQFRSIYQRVTSDSVVIAVNGSSTSNGSSASAYEIPTLRPEQSNAVEFAPMDSTPPVFSNGATVSSEMINGADGGDSSSIVIEMMSSYESGGDAATTNGVENEIETVSYDANDVFLTDDGLRQMCCVDDEEVAYCRSSCKSSLSRDSVDGVDDDFLDIDIDHEEEMEDFNGRLFEEPIQQPAYVDDACCSSATARKCNAYDDDDEENDLSDSEQRQLSPTRQTDRRIRGDDPEDEGVICQEGASSSQVVAVCAADCEACNRNEVTQIVGLLPPRIEVETVNAFAAPTSSRRRSPFFSIGGPNGRTIAEETFLACCSNVASTSKEDLGSSVPHLWRMDECSSLYFVWCFNEALRQSEQIGASACGATSLVNVLSALKWNSLSIEQIAQAVGTRRRAIGAPLSEYLLSRSNAGATHVDLIGAIEKLTWQRVRGRFFAMFPRRKVCISNWLLEWLKLGAIPVITANLQRGNAIGQTNIADAWHHQMVFGVDGQNRFVYLTNPVERVNETFVNEVLCSPSVLLVRADDVRQHWLKGCDVSALVNNADTRWTEMNVLGQICGVVREYSIPRSRCEPTVSHIAIPASYESGVTLFARADSATWAAIDGADDLMVDQR